MASSSTTADNAVEAAPQAKGGSWGSFLKSIASYNGDIASLTAPPFIIGTISLTEFSAYWTEHPSIFVAPAAEKDPAKRALLVLKWFLSTLKQSYSTRSDKYGTEKKPLNPFLGELYLGKWQDDAGTTHLVSEQVSHHPPVTAYCIWNDDHGVQLQGYNGQKVSFSRTIIIKQIGHALFRISSLNETYLITLPSLHIEGLLYGKPFVELDGNSYIISSTGFVSKIDYSGKGWLSGKKNSFSATLYAADKPKDILYTVDGQWTDSFTIKTGKGSSSALKKSSSEVVETYDANTPTTPLQVPTIEEQDPYESNRAWQHVKAGIEAGDLEKVHVEKTKIEQAQRALRRKEQEGGIKWQRRFFKNLEKDDLYDELSKGHFPQGIEAEKTGGIWRFDEEKKATAHDRSKIASDHAGTGVILDAAPPSAAPQDSTPLSATTTTDSTAPADAELKK